MTATLPVCVRGIAMSPRFIVVISVTHSNYHKPFLSSSRRWTHRQWLEVNHLFAHSTPTPSHIHTQEQQLADALQEAHRANTGLQVAKASLRREKEQQGWDAETRRLASSAEREESEESKRGEAQQRSRADAMQQQLVTSEEQVEARAKIKASLMFERMKSQQLLHQGRTPGAKVKAVGAGVPSAEAVASDDGFRSKKREANSRPSAIKQPTTRRPELLSLAKPPPPSTSLLDGTPINPIRLSSPRPARTRGQSDGTRGGGAPRDAYRESVVAGNYEVEVRTDEDRSCGKNGCTRQLSPGRHPHNGLCQPPADLPSLRQRPGRASQCEHSDEALCFEEEYKGVVCKRHAALLKADTATCIRSKMRAYAMNRWSQITHRLKYDTVPGLLSVESFRHWIKEVDSAGYFTALVKSFPLRDGSYIECQGSLLPEPAACNSGNMTNDGTTQPQRFPCHSYRPEQKVTTSSAGVLLKPTLILTLPTLSDL